MMEVKEKEVERATKKIVDLSREVHEGVIIAQVSPNGSIHVYHSPDGEIEGWGGNPEYFSDAAERVVFVGEADIMYLRGFPWTVVKADLYLNLHHNGYVVTRDTS